MANIKTAEADGPVLDWLVAKSKGWKIQINPGNGLFANAGDGYEYFTPSTSLAQGMPIVEAIATKIEDYGDRWGVEGPDAPEQFGPTILVAGLRCFVAKELGDEVDIPDELAQLVCGDRDGQGERVADRSRG